MYLKQVVVFLFVYLNCCYSASRVWLYKNCGRHGFTCVLKNKKVSVTFECPTRYKEYQLFVNEFNGPANIESLIVKNCRALNVFFRCTTHKSEKKNLSYLEISNVETLKIEHLSNYHSQLPPTVVFENIKFIRDIPSFTFSQIDKIQNKKCILPKSDFHSISFRDVTIDTVHSDAFHMPNGFGNVTFINSRINNFHASSMRVSHDKNGVFLMRESTVEALQPSALRIVGKSVIFSESKFAKISSSGINATVETFYFVNNSVNTLQPYALSILSTDTFILNNRFGWLKARALEKIGPRLLNGLGVKDLVYGYEFSGNYVNSTEADCLHPDVAAYEKVSLNIGFVRNELPCTCGKAEWLISATDNGHSTSPRDTFYNMAFNEQSQNICSSPCNLSIADTRHLLKYNICMHNSTMETLCQNRKEGSTEATTKATNFIILMTTRNIIPIRPPVTTTPTTRTAPTRPATPNLPSSTIHAYTQKQTTPTSFTKNILSTTFQVTSKVIPLFGSTKFRLINITLPTKSIPTDISPLSTVSPPRVTWYKNHTFTRATTLSTKLPRTTTRSTFIEHISTASVIPTGTIFTTGSSSYNQASFVCPVLLLFSLMYYIL